MRIIERKDGPVAYAKLKLPDGGQPQRRLGRLWTKRSAPPPGYVTRAQAEARLGAILAGDDALVNVQPSHVTFEAACDEHMRYLEHDRQRKTSYLRDCRSSINAHLLPGLGASTPVENITTENVDDLRSQMLTAGLAHKTAQKHLVLLGGILSRAKRKGWISVNPCDNAEKISVRRNEEFNVLDVEQVHAVARAAVSEQLAALIVVAAFTGLRQGELLALRWRHVNFGDRILHVRRNLPAGTAEEEAPKSHRIRSVPLSDQSAVALDGLSRREHFTGDDDLVFCTQVGGHLDDDNVRDAFYAASTPPRSATCARRTTRSSSTICGTRSARSARPRGSTCAESRRGWGTRTSRPPCATCTTSHSTTTPRASRPRSPPKACTQACTERASCTRTQRNLATRKRRCRAKR